jgi:hypothetical protein
MIEMTNEELLGKLHDLDYVHSIITRALWMMDRMVVPDDLDEDTKKYFERERQSTNHLMARAHVTWSHHRYRNEES